MTIPSGGGSEVLKRASHHGLNNAWQTMITGVANHIYTVLNITWAEEGGNPEGIGLRVDISAAGSNQVVLMNNGTSLPAYETFIWNDRIVLHPTHILKIYEQGNLTLNYWVSYIEQDWS